MRPAKKLTIWLLGFFAFVGVAQAGNEWVDIGFDRPGPAFETITLPTRHSPYAFEVCRQFCIANPQCRTWTYKSQRQDRPICELKSGVYEKDRQYDSVSGVLRVGPLQNTVWTGDYYKTIVLPNDIFEPEKIHFCRDLCSADGGCKAWTYFKPGEVQGRSNSVCRLKNAIPNDNEQRLSICCVSGLLADRDPMRPPMAPPGSPPPPMSK